MNFLEICQMVLDEGDQVGANMTTTVLAADTDEMERKVILWVNKAYKKIQRKNPFWNFLYNTGTFITTLADGTKDYTVADVRELFRDSLKINKQGETADWALQYLTYKEWRDLFLVTSSDLADGPPIWFIELPNGQYRIEPGPNAIYEIEADWYSKIDTLSGDIDEPLWDDDLHEIIVWEALKDFSLEYESSKSLGERVKATLPGLWREMYQQYSPEIELRGNFE